MRVKILKERRIKVSKLSTLVYPVGTTPDVDPDVAAQWIADGAAADLSAGQSLQLSEAETAVLKMAAGQIIDQTRALVNADGAGSAVPSGEPAPPAEIDSSQSAPDAAPADEPATGGKRRR